MGIFTVAPTVGLQDLSGPTSKTFTEASLLKAVHSRAHACLGVQALCCAVLSFWVHGLEILTRNMYFQVF